jgi:hypothetical protein
VLFRFWTDWVYRYLVRFLGHKIGETCRDLNTKSEGNKLRFPMPTQTQVFDNHSSRAEFGGSLKIRLANGLEVLPWFGQRRLHLLILIIKFLD